MRDTLFIEIEKNLKKNKNLFILTADLGFGIFEKIEKKYPNQFLNIGVAEQNLIGVGSGLASEGKTVIVYSIANFPVLRCLEQIRNDAAYHNVNLIIITCGAGFTYGQLGVSHHLTEDISIMHSIPNIDIYSPSTNDEVKFIFSKIMKRKGVSYLRIDKREVKTQKTKKLLYNHPLLYQKGSKIMIISTGTILEEVFKLSLLLKNNKKIIPSIISINNFKDDYLKHILKYLKNHYLVLTVEEHNLNGGMGSILNTFFLKNKKNIRNIEIINFGINNKFCSKIGDQLYLRKINKIDSLNIYKLIKKNIK